MFTKHTFTPHPEPEDEERVKDELREAELRADTVEYCKGFVYALKCAIPIYAVVIPSVVAIQKIIEIFGPPT